MVASQDDQLAHRTHVRQVAAQPGPLWTLYADLIVGRNVRRRSDHARGVVTTEVFRDPDAAFRPVATVQWDSNGSHEDVPLDQLRSWLLPSFAEDATLVPVKVLELQARKWVYKEALQQLQHAEDQPGAAQPGGLPLGGWGETTDNSAARQPGRNDAGAHNGLTVPGGALEHTRKAAAAAQASGRSAQHPSRLQPLTQQPGGNARTSLLGSLLAETGPGGDALSNGTDRDHDEVAVPQGLGKPRRGNQPRRVGAAAPGGSDPKARDAEGHPRSTPAAAGPASSPRPLARTLLGAAERQRTSASQGLLAQPNRPSLQHPLTGSPAALGHKPIRESKEPAQKRRRVASADLLGLFGGAGLSDAAPAHGDEGRGAPSAGLPPPSQPRDRSTSGGAVRAAARQGSAGARGDLAGGSDPDPDMLVIHRGPASQRVEKLKRKLGRGPRVVPGSDDEARDSADDSPVSEEEARAWKWPRGGSAAPPGSAGGRQAVTRLVQAAHRLEQAGQGKQRARHDSRHHTHLDQRDRKGRRREASDDSDEYEPSSSNGGESTGAGSDSSEGRSGSASADSDIVVTERRSGDPGKGAPRARAAGGAAGARQAGQQGDRRRRAGSSDDEPGDSPQGDPRTWVLGWTGIRYPRHYVRDPADRYSPGHEDDSEGGEGTTYTVQRFMDTYTDEDGVEWVLIKWADYELSTGSGRLPYCKDKGHWEPVEHALSGDMLKQYRAWRRSPPGWYKRQAHRHINRRERQRS